MRRLDAALDEAANASVPIGRKPDGASSRRGDRLSPDRLAIRHDSTERCQATALQIGHGKKFSKSGVRRLDAALDEAASASVPIGRKPDGASSRRGDRLSPDRSAIRHDSTERCQATALQIGHGKKSSKSGVRRLDAALDEAKTPTVPFKPIQHGAFDMSGQQKLYNRPTTRRRKNL